VTSDRRRHGPKIEGGVDAVVVGSTPDAMVASAMLAKAGLHVVEIETGAGRFEEKREFAPGFWAIDGDPLAAALDQGVIDALDLYRHGLSFSRRRLETFVRFSDGAALVLPGDPALAGEAVAAMSEADATPFERFLDDERRAARSLAGWFSGGEAPAALAGPTAEAATSSFDGAIVGRFADSRLEDFLRAEAALGAAVRPTEAYSYFALLKRFSGDAAGLQGAVAAIEGGGRALAGALRRAGQAQGVVVRQTDRVKNVIVEWDRVAGVEFDDGGQIRAPIIISALPARETFLDLVGRARLNVEFARLLDAKTAGVASVRAHLAIKGTIAEPHVAMHPDRRFLFAPTGAELDRAFSAAGEGGATASLIAEMVFPSALDPSLAHYGRMTASMLLHPVAFGSLEDAAFRGAVEAAATAGFARIAPGSETQIEAIDLDGPVRAAPPVLAAIERRSRLTEGAGLEGYFFCGPEASLGGPQSLTAGRRAGERALKFYKSGGAAA
jgi:phytoene dehydrogenase-like protein